MEHEMLPRVEPPFDFDRPEGHDGPGFTRVIQIELESFGETDPAMTVKQIQYQVEDMIKAFKLRYMDLYHVDLAFDVCWVERD